MWLFLLIFFAFIGVFWVGERIDKWLHKMDSPRQLNEHRASSEASGAAVGDYWDDDEWVQ